MTPKEKAQELLSKFAVGGWRKEHATTCVDEIIKEYDEEILESNDVNRIEYWRQVKDEIEALS